VGLDDWDVAGTPGVPNRTSPFLAVLLARLRKMLY
jgi:hypothetical protein